MQELLGHYTQAQNRDDRFVLRLSAFNPEAELGFSGNGVVTDGTDDATFGFSDQATLDDGGLWPTSFAIHRFGDAEAATLAALLRKAAG